MVKARKLQNGSIKKINYITPPLFGEKNQVLNWHLVIVSRIPTHHCITLQEGDLLLLYGGRYKKWNLTQVF
jgi:hypothetical protein